ncbi:MAG TPA: cupin domain-containing protein [Aminobacterium sp.]|jgi:mannose-6-phosphate isomerase-like protein (cupin superfamily)|uniref:cupin domain-containing protein n=1 Tax=Aminobacterium TaxID=81466 RepID=UPI000464ED04|nr:MULTISPECIES: cupin domain-containing protein [Aminobacterium]HCA40666.1 cupin domain-containing protein [Aminobacterium sp.]
MIIRSSQIEGLESHPLFGVLEGVESRSIHPDDFYEESMFHEISWVEMEPGASIPIHEHEGCEEVKIIVYGIGMYTEGRQKERIGAGDVILTERGLEHSLENIGSYPLVYIAITSRCNK